MDEEIIYNICNSCGARLIYSWKYYQYKEYFFCARCGEPGKLTQSIKHAKLAEKDPDYHFKRFLTAMGKNAEITTEMRMEYQEYMLTKGTC